MSITAPWITTRAKDHNRGSHLLRYRPSASDDAADDDAYDHPLHCQARHNSDQLLHSIPLRTDLLFPNVQRVNL